MSLSSDFAAARHKSSSLMHDAAEHHPLLMTLASFGALVAGLILVTRLFMS